MTMRSRFAVPADQLDAVRVPGHEQVQEQPEPRAPESAEWAGRLPPAFGDGGGADADGD